MMNDEDIKRMAKDTYDFLMKNIHLGKFSDVEELSSDHIQYMLLSIFYGKVTGYKAHRWLGWAQCAIVSSGIGNLKMMKNINSNQQKIKVKKWVKWIGNPDEREIHWNDPDIEKYIQGLKEEGRIITGSEHQSLDDGMPIFEDDSVMSLSLKGWGNMMAKAFGGSYNDYYM